MQADVGSQPLAVGPTQSGFLANPDGVSID